MVELIADRKNGVIHLCDFRKFIRRRVFRSAKSWMAPFLPLLDSEAARIADQRALEFILARDGEAAAIRWFGPEDIPKTGPFKQLNDMMNAIKAEGKVSVACETKPELP